LTLLVEFKQSHRYSFNTPIKGAFQLVMVPVSSAPATGLHYILLLDVSGSMKGAKIEAVKKAARRLIEKLHGDNYVTLILFGTAYPFYKIVASHEKLADAREKLLETIDSLVAQDGTPLYNALREAVRIAEASKEPGYIVLITDGKPTDVTSVEKYAKLKWPKRYRGVFIGIGMDYNAELLNKLADLSGGVAVHVDEANLEELVGAFEEAAASEAAAKDVNIVVEAIAGNARILGYEEPSVYIPAISDEAVELIGEVDIPKNYDGDVAKIIVTYLDPATGKMVSSEYSYHVKPARSREEFLSGIDRGVYNTYLYMVYMDEARRLALEGRLDEATRRLEKAAEAASQTRRVDLIESTKRLVEEVSSTKRMSPDAATRRLASEATKRLRG